MQEKVSPYGIKIIDFGCSATNIASNASHTELVTAEVEIVTFIFVR